MKILRSIFSALLLFALVTPVAITVTSCANQQSTSYKTLLIVGQEVDSLMIQAGNLWRAHEITDAQRDKIIAFHDQKFNPVYLAAVDASSLGKNAWADPALLDLLSQLKALVPPAK